MWFNWWFIAWILLTNLQKWSDVNIRRIPTFPAPCCVHAIKNHASLKSKVWAVVVFLCVLCCTCSEKWMCVLVVLVEKCRETKHSGLTGGWRGLVCVCVCLFRCAHMYVFCAQKLFVPFRWTRLCCHSTCHMHMHQHRHTHLNANQLVKLLTGRFNYIPNLIWSNQLFKYNLWFYGDHRTVLRTFKLKKNPISFPRERRERDFIHPVCEFITNNHEKNLFSPLNMSSWSIVSSQDW